MTRTEAALKWCTKYLAFLMVMGVAVFTVALCWAAALGAIFLCTWMLP